jgi:hypothetical protein
MKEPLVDMTDFLKRVFDAIPSLTFVVDDDVRIVHLNSTALTTLGAERTQILLKRSGEILHCIHATETPEGCGHAGACKDCIIRNAVRQSVRGGMVYREAAGMELQKNGKVSEAFFLVTTAPFQYNNTPYVLLTLEDITERHLAERTREGLIAELQEALRNIRTLHGLIPICSSCKKVRDDRGYWQQVEVYIRDHSDAEPSRGICPECFKKMYPKYVKDDE